MKTHNRKGVYVLNSRILIVLEEGQECVYPDMYESDTVASADDARARYPLIPKESRRNAARPKS